MPNSPLNLLAPDGILRVTFSQPVSEDQALAVRTACQSAQSVDQLEQAVAELGKSWAIPTFTEIISRKTAGLAP